MQSRGAECFAEQEAFRISLPGIGPGTLQSSTTAADTKGIYGSHLDL
jgi:hypothetical protein